MKNMWKKNLNYEIFIQMLTLKTTKKINTFIH